MKIRILEKFEKNIEHFLGIDLDPNSEDSETSSNTVPTGEDSGTNSSSSKSFLGLGGNTDSPGEDSETNEPVPMFGSATSNLKNNTDVSSEADDLIYYLNRKKNNSYVFFYIVFIILILSYNDDSNFNIIGMCKGFMGSKALNKLSYIIIFLIIIPIIYFSYVSNIPEYNKSYNILEDNKGLKTTKYIKYVFYPIFIVILLTILSIKSIRKNKSNSLALILITVFTLLPILVMTIINLIVIIISNSVNIGSYNSLLIPIYFIILIFIIIFNKGLRSCENFTMFSIPTIGLIILFSTVIFRIINNIILIYQEEHELISNYKGISVERFKDIMNRDESKYNVDAYYSVYNNYSLKKKQGSGLTIFLDTLKYIVSLVTGIINIIFYYLIGRYIIDKKIISGVNNIIGYNKKIEKKNDGKSSNNNVMTGGMNNSISNIKKPAIFNNVILNKIIGALSTKVLLTNYSSSGIDPFSSVLSYIIIALKYFFLFTGKKVNILKFGIDINSQDSPEKNNNQKTGQTNQKTDQNANKTKNKNTGQTNPTINQSGGSSNTLKVIIGIIIYFILSFDDNVDNVYLKLLYGIVIKLIPAFLLKRT